VSSEILSNAAAWGLLMGLTMASFFVSESRAALLTIVTVAGVKCALVGLQFMGLRASRPLVRAAFLALFAALVVALFVAHRHG